MSRNLRFTEPGTTYHVVQKAVAEASIFGERAAREFYLARLASIARAEGVIVLAYAIMDTHVHLLIFVPRSLERFMRRLGTSFAQYYNKLHDRAGHVFGRSFWSKAIESSWHLMLTLRYILLNPFKGGLHSGFFELERSDRTNFPAFLGRTAFLRADAEEALRFFGADAGTARVALREFLARGNGVFSPEKYEVEETSGGRADRHRSQEALDDSLRDSVRQKEIEDAGWTIVGIERFVCAKLEVTVAELQAGSRVRPLPLARALIGYLARVELGCPLTQVAQHLDVSASAVHQALERGRYVAARRALTLVGSKPPAEDSAEANSETPG